MGRMSTCQKNCKTIDLRGAQVNECIMKCLQSADEMCIPRKNKNHFTPVPGWNEYLSRPYDESRQAYIIWNSYNRPRSGPVHELMKRTRARFKYAQRLVQKHEDMLRADALANKLSSGDVVGKMLKTAAQEQ